MEFVIELLSSLKQQLEQIELSEEIIRAAQDGFKATEAALLTLKSFIVTYIFKDVTEEIYFFKELKPQFYALLIFYVQLFDIETHKPAGAKKDLRKYLKNRLRTITRFSYDNREFYKYIRSGATYLDQQYFARDQYDITLGFDTAYFDCDPKFTTSHDYKMSQLLANERLADHLAQSVSSLDSANQEHSFISELELAWAETNAALVEFIYLAQASGAFFNRKKNMIADVKDVANFFQRALQVDLGNYYRTFQEIRIRKNRTSFTDRSRNNLIRRMDDSDLNPR